MRQSDQPWRWVVWNTCVPCCLTRSAYTRHPHESSLPSRCPVRPDPVDAVRPQWWHVSKLRPGEQNRYVLQALLQASPSKVEAGSAVAGVWPGDWRKAKHGEAWPRRCRVAVKALFFVPRPPRAPPPSTRPYRAPGPPRTQRSSLRILFASLFGASTTSSTEALPLRLL